MISSKMSKEKSVRASIETVKTSKKIDDRKNANIFNDDSLALRSVEI
jgi:hypothetical protein